MSKQFIWKVLSEKMGLRLIDFLSLKLKTFSFSKRFIKKIIEKGLCRVNGRIELFASKSISFGDHVVLDKNWQNFLEAPKSIKPKILFEDDDFLIIDKPSSFLCEDSVIHKFFSKNYTLIHRLDKATSGVLLIAKNMKIKTAMKQIFSKKQIKKSYLAVVDGNVKDRQGKIEGCLKRSIKIDGQTIWKLSVSKNGIYSLTYWQSLQSKKDFSVLLAFPITGRTHQLRVHLKEIGHPILGDFLYNKTFLYKKFVPRLLLHCFAMEFIHPKTLENISVQADMPKDFFPFYQNVSAVEREVRNFDKRK